MGAWSPCCEGLDVGPGLVVEIGDRHLGAQPPEGQGAAEGDRVGVGDPYNQSLAALESSVRWGIHRKLLFLGWLDWAHNQPRLSLRPWWRSRRE